MTDLNIPGREKVMGPEQAGKPFIRQKQARVKVSGIENAGWPVSLQRVMSSEKDKSEATPFPHSYCSWPARRSCVSLSPMPDSCDSS